MLRRAWIVVASIISLFSVAQYANAAEINTSNYDIYAGDVNGDGYSDYYFAGKRQLILLHGDIVTPIFAAGAANFIINGNNGNYSVTQPVAQLYTLDAATLTQKITQGVLRTAFEGVDYYVWSEGVAGKNSVFLQGGTGLAASILLNSFANQSLPVFAQTYPVTSAPSLTIASAAFNSSGSYKVLWTKVADATRYELYENNYRIQSTANLDVNFSGVTARQSGTYAYQVRACSSDCGPLSNIATVTVSVSGSSNSSSSSSISSSSSSSAGSAFDFNSQAPSNFKFALNSAGIPSLGASQNVATTQGDINVANGAAAYTVKLDLPPAVRDLKPKLALSYNSRSGNGLMGMGWSLSGLSSITRCRVSFAVEGAETQKSKPRYSNGDRLCLDGQKLVLNNNSTAPAGDADYWVNGSEYKTEIDNFGRVIAYSSDNGSHAYFKVFTKDGRILTYGGETDSQNSRIHKPGNSTSVVGSWLLDKVEDAYGNSYTITYFRDTASGNYYPDRINFAPNSVVKFEYQARSGQTPSGYDMGGYYQYPNLLKSVTTYIDVSSSTSFIVGTPVKQYQINYKLSANTQRDLVDAISECGFSNGSWQCARPLTFTWQQGEFGFDDTQPKKAVYCSSGVQITKASVKQVIDLDGDGYNDLLTNDVIWGTPEGCFNPSGFNPGELTFTQPLMTRSGYALLIGQKLESGEVKVSVVSSLRAATRSHMLIATLSKETGGDAAAVDRNNDGLDDIVAGSASFLQLDQEILGFISGPAVGGPHTLGSPNYIDVNGDGLKDRVLMQDNIMLKMTTADGVEISPMFWMNPIADYVVSQNSYYGGARVLLSGGLKRVIGDINGDGQKDYVYYHLNNNPVSSSNPNGGKYEWMYRLNRQSSTGDEVNTQIVHPATESQEYPANAYSYGYDWDKDGRDDVLDLAPRPNMCHLRVLLSRDSGNQTTFVELKDSSGNTFTTRMLDETICAPLYVEQIANIFKGDVNNDGVLDVWNMYDAIYYGKPQQPDLLTVVTDGFGAQAKFEYSTLTGADNNGKPLYTPDAVKPSFPQVPASRSMQVVKKLSISNAQGGFNDRVYNYTGARTDLQGRGFLGFANIQATDLAADVITSTDYRQSFPYIGRIDNVTTKTASGALISSTKNVYTTHAGNARFPYVDSTLQKNYQLTTTDLNNPLSVTKVKNTYDVCGNLTEQISDTGNGLSGGVVTGVLSHLRVANDVNYYNTSACNDDFVYRTTKEASKTSVSDDLRVTVTEFEPNSVKEIGKITAFQGTPLQKVTVIDRAANGVVTGSSEVANDIDGATVATRATTGTDLAKNLFPQTITNILSSGNHVTTVGYDYRFGLERSISTPNLQTTNRTYDYLGRLTEESQGDGTHSEIISFYCSSAPVSCPVGAYYGVATKVTNTNLAGVLGAPLTIVYYDSLQREVRNSIYSMDGKAINTDKVYRTDGKLSAVSEPFVTTGGSGSASYWTNYSNYDALGRPHTVTGPDGGSQTTNYEKYSTSLKITETVTVIGPRTSDTQITQRFINPVGQVTQVIDANNTPVDYTYNSTGNLETTKVNNNINTQVIIGYDSQGNKNHIVDPDAGVIDFDYNGFGELRRQIWQKDTASVKSMVLVYDQLGRQTSRVDQPVTGSPTTYTWVWDTKLKGLLTSESGNGQALTYGYDGFARLKTLTTSIAGVADRNFVYDYDDFSRPTKVTYPNGFGISRQYHAAGMAVQTTDVTDSANPRVLWALGNDLDARGNFNNQLWGNGVVTQTGFDGQNGQLKTIKSGRLTSASLNALNGDIQALSYEYDTIGNLHTRTSQRTNAAGVALENIREEFVYDKLNRLKTSTTSGLFARFNDYGYDELGNLTSRTSKLGTSTTNDDVGVLSYVPSLTNNAGVHAVTSVAGQSYQYDKYGNMTKRGGDTIDYDVFNKPIRIVGSSITTIDYDANHDRFREVNGTTTTYTLAGGLYEEVVEGAKTTQKSYVDGVILNTKVLNSGVVASNDTVYLHTDNLGSVEAISSRLGGFVSRMSFSDWGKRQQSDWKTGSPVGGFPTQNGYTGHHEMDQHNLVHMGGRVYDPGLGRFLSADLFVQSPYSTQSFNRYSYVANNPLSQVDPSGYCGVATWTKGMKDSTYETSSSGCMDDNPWYHDDNSGGGSNFSSWGMNDAQTVRVDANQALISNGLYDQIGDGLKFIAEEGIELSGIPDGFEAGMGAYIDLKNGKGYKEVAGSLGIAASALLVKKAKVAEKVVEKAAGSLMSRIKESSKLVREAQAAGKSHQDSLDKLTAKLKNGNLNPGVGTKPIGSGLSEARARDGARVYFRTNENGVEILGKSNKANQATVIDEVLKIFGG